VSRIPARAESGADSPIAPLGMARKALDLFACGLCWPFHGLNVFGHSGHPFKMVRVNSASTITAVEKLRASFVTHGIPEVLVSDNGPTFTSQEFGKFLKGNGIHHIRIAPYHPASNRLAERAVQTLKTGLKKQPLASLDTKLSRWLFDYRTTPHSTTGIAPVELLMGRRLQTRLSLLFPNLTGKVKKQQEAQHRGHDNSRRERQFQVEDKVWGRNYANGPTWVKGTIESQTGPKSFEVRVGNVVVKKQLD